MAKQVKTSARDAGCFERAAARGQRTFTLVAQDKTAPVTICLWIAANIERAPAEKLRAALEDALQMRSHPIRKWAD